MANNTSWKEAFISIKFLTPSSPLLSFTLSQRHVEEQEDEIEELKASRRRKALSGPDRDGGGMRERDRERDRQWCRGWESGRGRSRGDNQLPDARPQSRPHVATSRGFKRSSDMAGSGQGWFRDGEMREEIDGDDRSYASEAGDRSPNCDDSPVADKHDSTSRSRSNMENNGSSSNSSSRRRTSGSHNADRSAYSHKGSRQGGQSDRDREIVEETLAMQTMSLIHGQLTAMKHQLLTISDVSTIPDTESDVTRSQGRPSQVQRKDSSFQSK